MILTTTKCRIYSGEIGDVGLVGGTTVTNSCVKTAPGAGEVSEPDPWPIAGERGNDSIGNRCCLRVLRATVNHKQRASCSCSCGVTSHTVRKMGSTVVDCGKALDKGLAFFALFFRAIAYCSPSFTSGKDELGGSA